MDAKAQLVFSLQSIGAIKFGAYKLKSGILSPFYLDLRILVSYPGVLRETAQVMAQLLSTLKFDRIAAIPYAALPIGTAVALEMDRPLIYPRREKKDYGTGRAVEGEYRAGETAVVIDDVITTGVSKLEAIQPLSAAKLKVHDIVVLIDREQGGAHEVSKRGYQVHSVLKITEVMQILKEAGKATESQQRDVLAFLSKNGGSQ
ncbi:MAG: orotate phosphoribosyltransferase [Chloroflexota bacterium]|nr:orotate phosphoribosyltransferase [Chloroflexota bacterium]